MQVVKVDLWVQEAKDNHEHQSHQLQLDKGLLAKTETQYTLEYQQTLRQKNQLVLMERLWPAMLSKVYTLRGRYPSGLKPSESTEEAKNDINITKSWIFRPSHFLALVASYGTNIQHTSLAYAISATL